MPHTSSANIIARAAQDLISAIKSTQPATPFDSLSQEDQHALEELADIFHTYTAPRVEEEIDKSTPTPPTEKDKQQTPKPTQRQTRNSLR